MNAASPASNLATRVTTITRPRLSQPPAHWAWHYHKLQAVLDRLLGQRSEHIDEASTSIEPHSMDLADSASDEMDHDIALGLLSSEQDAIYEVVSAIQRIIDGTYGICEDTGRPIPAERLRAVPWSRRTKEAEERAERAGLNPHAHLGRLSSVQGTKAAGLSEVDEPANEELLGRELARHQREQDLRAIIDGSAQN
jgi:RNA polymerase-binding transcription factor DksA